MTADQPPPRPEGPEPELDVDAAFAEIVARFGPVSTEVVDTSSEAPSTPPSPSSAPAVAPPPPREPAPREPAAREPAPREPATADGPASADALNSSASWEDEGHFVPPPPPPLPAVDPRRRLGWIGLLGAPVLGVLLLLLPVAIPRVLTVALVFAFVGGFGYLVATMGPSRPEEWSGDDGAVL